MKKVVLSENALRDILCETKERITTETGGIFLGHREEDTWYVIESIDPGPNSIFSTTYFEYDDKYTNHLANKTARKYRQGLNLLGLWHRHPGSMTVFSRTDDGTNEKYARLLNGAISALVNLDPKFRMTMYYVPRDCRYQQIEVIAGDEHIPKKYIELKNVEELEKDISDYNERHGYQGPPRQSVQNTVRTGENDRKFKEMLLELLEDDYAFLDTAEAHELGIEDSELMPMEDRAILIVNAVNSQNQKEKLEFIFKHIKAKVYIQFDYVTITYKKGMLQEIFKTITSPRNFGQFKYSTMREKIMRIMKGQIEINRRSTSYFENGLNVLKEWLK